MGGRGKADEVGVPKRVREVKIEDNLRPEGEFLGERRRRGWCPGDRVREVRRQDNLRMEGAFMGRRREGGSGGMEDTGFTQTLRAKLEQEREKREREGSSWEGVEGRRGDGPSLEHRPMAARQPDNLRPEGTFQGRPAGEGWAVVERVRPVRREDNLAMAGDFQGREVARWPRARERSFVLN